MQFLLRSNNNENHLKLQKNMKGITIKKNMKYQLARQCSTEQSLFSL